MIYDSLNLKVSKVSIAISSGDQHTVQFSSHKLLDVSTKG